MHYTLAEITGWLGSFLWPLFRIGAMVTAAPIFGSRSIPARGRLIFALALTLVIAPTLPAVPAVDPFSWQGLLIIFQQVLIGIAMGFVLQLVFATIITGGQMIAMQMGLGFASMVDPQNGVQVPVVSQVYLMMTTLLFLAMNGHLVFIELVAESFTLMPIGGEVMARETFQRIALLGSNMFAGAVWLALPAVASLLMINISFGVMARAAPQLNIFAIGFPFTMMMGFIIIYLTLPSVIPQFESLMEDGFAVLRSILGAGQ